MPVPPGVRGGWRARAGSESRCWKVGGAQASPACIPVGFPLRSQGTPHSPALSTACSRGLTQGIKASLTGELHEDLSLRRVGDGEYPQFGVGEEPLLMRYDKHRLKMSSLEGVPDNCPASHLNSFTLGHNSQTLEIP